MHNVGIFLVQWSPNQLHAELMEKVLCSLTELL